MNAVRADQIPGGPLVSVVTPFYNSAPFLSQCIESVLAQRDANLEYVLLDNCSDDGSSEIATRHAKLDPRIRLIRNQSLLPQVPNYNAALSHIAANARYVKVVEADNWVFPDCVARMVELAEANPRVGVVCSYNATETRLRFTGLPLRTSVLSGVELFNATFGGDSYLFGAPSTVLMRADLVRSRRPFYDESFSTAEDLSACWDLLRECDFGFVHQVLTFVRTENDSILSKIRGMDGQELDRFLLIGRHALDFLGAKSANAFVKEAERRYYRAIARGLLRGRPGGFLSMHCGRLAKEGIPFVRHKLALALLQEIGWHLVRTDQLLEAVKGRRSRQAK